MEIRVGIDDFVDAAKKFAPNGTVILLESPEGVHCSVAEPDGNVVVRSDAPVDLPILMAKLEAAGCKFNLGRAASGPVSGDHSDTGETFIAAVSYRSRDLKPGVWIDAFPYEPSELDVLRAMYAEFLETGEVKDVGLEEFSRLSLANVVIVTGTDLQRYRSAKDVD